MSKPREQLQSDVAALATVVDEFLMLVQESADYHMHPEVKSTLYEVTDRLSRVQRRLVQFQERYVVAIVGLTNVGKSTLLNALFGSELAPRRNGPCTAAPIEFAYGHTLQVTVQYAQNAYRPRWQCETLEEIHQVLARLTDEREASSLGNIVRVIVETPNTLLKSGLVVVDTPGFGAVQTGTQAGSHDASVRRYLENSISQVFWVVLAEQGIGNREKQFHDQLIAQVCDDIIVTGCEDWTSADRERFRRRFGALFELRMPQFHFVSGLQGLEARLTGDAQQLESAGIRVLETHIQALADPHQRSITIQQTILQIADDLGYWLHSFREKGRRLEPRWRPDSLARWRSRTNTCPLAKQVQQSLMR